MRFTLLTNAIALGIVSFALTACGGSDDKTNNKKEETSSSKSYEVQDGISMNIMGAGASFPSMIYDKWATEYNQETGAKVGYQSISSSYGVEQILAKAVDFGASDRPLTVSELETNHLIQFPTVIGGIVPIVNLEGVASGQLILDGNTLAKIYLGEIRQWNDPAIAKLNPNTTLPNAKITTVHRQDGSGTTFNFSYYLNEVSPRWAKVGVGKQLDWPTDAQGSGIGVDKNAGIADAVRQTSNSIGYIDYAYAKKYNLTYTSMINRAGNIVKPSNESFASAGDVDWSKVPGFYKLIANSEVKNAWPIATTTFVLVNKNPENPEQVAGVLNFFNWAYMKGYQSALDLDFVPFSDKPVAVFLTEWEKIVDKNGKPVYKIKSSV